MHWLSGSNSPTFNVCKSTYLVLDREKILPKKKFSKESKIARIATFKTQNTTKLLKFCVRGTRKVHPDNKAIPWITASKSIGQKYLQNINNAQKLLIHNGFHVNIEN